MVMVVFMAGTTCRSANATEGFYLGGTIGQEYVSAEFKKSIHHAQPPASYRTSEDDTNGTINAFKAFLGYRWLLSNRFYVSGEIEGTLYSDNRITGFLERSTNVRGVYEWERDIWPGGWAFEKNRSIGFNAKLGYVPETLAFLGKGRSLYLISGLHWLDATTEVSFDNMQPNEQRRAGTVRVDHSTLPWLVGGGVEFGSRKNRFDFRIQYSRYDVDFDETEPLLRINHEFEMAEWGMYLGYVRALEFGS